MDKGAWQATVHEVTKSQTRLSVRARTHTHTHSVILPSSKKEGNPAICDISETEGHYGK